jgi:hypothetical protein
MIFKFSENDEFIIKQLFDLYLKLYKAKNILLHDTNLNALESQEQQSVRARQRLSTAQ